jgi:hypothetical protein
VQRVLAFDFDAGAVGTERCHPDGHVVEDLLGSPARLLLDEGRLVLVGEEERGAFDKMLHLRTVEPGELPGGVRGEIDPEVPALRCEAQHRLGVRRADQHQVGLAGEVVEPQVAVLGHRAGVERGDLVPDLVGRGDETRGVPERGLTHPAGVNTVAFQPGPVLGEVRARAANQQRAQTQTAETERDIGRHPAAPDLQLVDEERQGNLVQLVRDQLIVELAGELHQVIGGDRPGDGYAHGGKTRAVSGTSRRRRRNPTRSGCRW